MKFVNFFAVTAVLFSAMVGAAQTPSNYVLPVTDFLNQCDGAPLKSDAELLISTNKAVDVMGTKKKMTLRQYAAELVRSMSQGTSDQSTKPSEIVFTDYYRFPDTYPSAVNQMDEISHSLRVTFRTPSGAQYFFHVVTPTYKLFNLKLPFSDSDSDDLQGTEGSFLDSGTASLDQVRSLDLCAPMKIDGRSDGRFGR